MVHKIEESKFGTSGGSESALTGLAGFILGVGILGAVACFYFAAQTFHRDGGHITWTIIGVATLLQSIVLFIVLRVGADAIRLLKKQNELPYSGEITTPQRIVSYHCPECSTEVCEFDIVCHDCRLEFVEPEIEPY